MSYWEPCIKCGMFVTAGMGTDLNTLTCKWCSTDDTQFSDDSSIEEGDTVRGKHFERGVVKYVGAETEVEVLDAKRIGSGKHLTFDKYHLEKISSESE